MIMIDIMVRRAFGPARWKVASLLALASAVAMGMSVAASAQVYLPPLGGPGGGQFKSSCPAGQSLIGVELSVADDVDAIRPICAVTYGPDYADSGAAIGSSNGGAGGVRVERLTCPPARPVVLAVSIGAEGEKTLIVNDVHLFCGLAVTTDQPLEDYPSAIFDGPGYKPSPRFLSFTPGTSNQGYTSERCPTGEVAVGVHGRSGLWVDSIGLICGAPLVVRAPVSLGRGSPAAPRAYRSICEAARDARAKNSPAAPSLERQCSASTGSATMSLQRKTPAVPSGVAPPAKSTVIPVCQLAADAKAHGWPTGALDARCKALQDQQQQP